MEHMRVLRLEHPPYSYEVCGDVVKLEWYDWDTPQGKISIKAGFSKEHNLLIIYFAPDNHKG